MILDEFAEINPSITLLKNTEYDFVGMEVIIPSNRYVKSERKRSFSGGGAKFKNGDVLFARITPCLENGKIAQYKSMDATGVAFGSTEFIVFRGKEGVSNTDFLFYLVSSSLVREPAIKSMSGASGRQRVNLTAVKNIIVQPPAIETQQKIASILSAYDDLIENNTRRIQILEEMARRIYEEWFVRFRFPGHENIKMVESELGFIPEGWEVKKLGDLLLHHIGGGWGAEELISDFCIPAFVIRGTDIPTVQQGSIGKSPLRYHKKSNFESRQLTSGDIVFEISGGSKEQPVGRAALISEQFLRGKEYPMICASFCRLIRADRRKILPELLLLHLQKIYDSMEIIKYQTQSTGITNFKFTLFLETEKLLSISPQLQEQFADVVLPFFHLIATLGKMNENLKTTRDLLLPKLISGEIDVSGFPEPKDLRKAQGKAHESK